ncbi:hypothetical protein ACFWHT_00940 [Microbacterium sp. NPDC058342]|uniref:hypothetical protein n=1 Tax=Microbacterium sp. NPDC058342 TaxID=3346454 RepID=UPI0036623913
MADAAPDLHAFDLPRIAAGAPYRPFPSAGDPRWRGRDAESTAAVLAAAAEAARTPAPELTEEQWLAFHRDGERRPYETPYFERRRRLTLAALAAALAPGPATEQTLQEAIRTILTETTWCVPAHNRQPGGDVDELPDPDHPVVDLFAAETAALLAWTLSIHERRLGGLAASVSAEVDRRVIAPFERDARKYFWFGLASNWNPWIVSNVLTAALLTPPPDGRGIVTVLHAAVESLDAYARNVPQDGGCPEGIMYWWQSGARFFEAIELLGLGDPGAAAGVLSSDLLHRTAEYPLVVGLGDGVWNAAFADGRGRTLARSGGSMNERYSPELLFRFGAAVGDEDIRRYARVMRGAQPPVLLPLPLGRALAAFFDDEWCAAAPASEPMRTGTRWLSETEVFAADSGSLRLVAKGGHNDEPHNHLDVGSFVIGSGGEPLIIDVGSGLYTAASFTDARYEQWFTRSEFHSVPLGAGGAQQGVGARHRASGVSADADDAWRFSLDLAGAYPAGVFDSWRRTFARIAGGIRIDEEWRADAAPTVVLMLARPPRPQGEGWALIGPDSGEARALLTADADAEWEEIPLDDPMLRASWGASVTRMSLTPRSESLHVDVRAL